LINAYNQGTKMLEDNCTSYYMGKNHAKKLADQTICKKIIIYSLMLRKEHILEP